MTDKELAEAAVKQPTVVLEALIAAKILRPWYTHPVRDGKATVTAEFDIHYPA